MTDIKKRATREAYGEVLIKLGEKYENLVVTDADLSGSTKTAGFGKVFPERFFNLGIAEQNMYGVATGLAHSGKVVCASTFAMFATGRAFEIIRNSIGYTGANVKICATHAGITTGEDGGSHQTFEDMALMSTIPGMTVINPSDDISTAKLMEQVVAFDGPAYVRLGRSAVPTVYSEDSDIKIGNAMMLRDGKDVSIMATGIMVSKALEAAKILAKQGILAQVWDVHTIKPLDSKAVIDAAAKTGKIVTAEEHSIIGGLGCAVAGILCGNMPCPLAMVGQQDIFGESGRPGELLEKYGMTANDIVKAAEGLCQK